MRRCFIRHGSEGYSSVSQNFAQGYPAGTFPRAALLATGASVSVSVGRGSLFLAPGKLQLLRSPPCSPQLSLSVANSTSTPTGSAARIAGGGRV